MYMILTGINMQFTVQCDSLSFICVLLNLNNLCYIRPILLNLSSKWVESNRILFYHMYYVSAIPYNLV